jgi:hypothetical protein
MVKDIPEGTKPRRHWKKPKGDGTDAGDKARVRRVEKSRLIPYSVYLDPEIHEALKEKARSRQASKMVRDAITMILEGSDQFTSGYKQALRDVADMVHRDELATSVSVNERRISDHLIDQIESMTND